MICTKQKMLLYAVTDRSHLYGQDLQTRVEAALRGGATMVQLREKTLTDAAFLEEAKAMKVLCKQYGVPLIINDRADIARDSGADGVHLGQKDGSVQQARAILGKDKIIGVSSRTVAQALQAQADGADYIGSGAVFQTGTKADAKPLDHAVLQQICAAVTIPVVAIGGITADNILQLAGTGISGAAVVSALFGKEDVEQAAQQMRQLCRQIVGDAQ